MVVLFYMKQHAKFVVLSSQLTIMPLQKQASDCIWYREIDHVLLSLSLSLCWGMELTKKWKACEVFRVLVVDHDSTSLKTVCKMLDLCGYEGS